MATKKWTIKKIIRTIWITGGVIFTVWMFYSYQAHGVAKGFFQNSETTKVEESSDFFLFTPTSPFKEVLIFYPEAMVDQKAYVPLCKNYKELPDVILLKDKRRVLANTQSQEEENTARTLT